MANAFLVLCSRHRQQALVGAGCVGQPLIVLFGGPHQSAPRFTTFGVQPGDAIYPVAVRRGIMHIVGRLDVDEVIPLRRYLASRFGIPDSEKIYWWEEVGRLLAEQPALLHLLPEGCIDEAAVGEGRTAIRFDRAVPGAVLERLRLKSRTGPERGLRYLEDGRLKNVQTLLGRVYRLSEASAQEFAELFAQLEATAIPKKALQRTTQPSRRSVTFRSSWPSGQ